MTPDIDPQYGGEHIHHRHGTFVGNWDQFIHDQDYQDWFEDTWSDPAEREDPTP